jgi:hypothetical protein
MAKPKWYFVCACGAKWFAPARVMGCPRCGSVIESCQQFVPPWEVNHVRSDDGNGRGSGQDA